MNFENLKRAAEIDALMDACTAVRTSLSEAKTLTINGIEMPQEMVDNILQVINLKINQIRDEVKTL